MIEGDFPPSPEPISSRAQGPSTSLHWPPPLLPSLPLPPLPPLPGTAGFAARPPADTLADAIAYIDARGDWSETVQDGLKTAVRQLGRSISLIRSRDSGQPTDGKKLDLGRIPLDLPAINRDLEGKSYRRAGFNSEKSCRNMRYGFRRVCREMGKIGSKQIPYLPPDTPYARLLAQATPYQRSAARLFASRLHQQGLHPTRATDAHVAEHAVFLASQMMGVKVSATLRRIVRVWNKIAERDPTWPRLTLPGKGRQAASPPLSTYPAALQAEIANIGRWMEGHNVPGMGGSDPARSIGHRRGRVRRPDTIVSRMKSIRLILGIHVALGHDPQTMTTLRHLLNAHDVEAILQALWERGQARLEAIPEAERAYNETDNTAQMDAAAQTLMMLAASCFPQPPDVLKEIRALARQARKTRPDEMTLKNQKRLEQFDDLAVRYALLTLPATMMAEAMAIRHKRPAEAARCARTAVIIGIECRIPLRIKNLTSCRLGHNLRFSGAHSQVVTLGFQESETKNHLKIEFYVGARLCGLLDTYIKHFLPIFSEQTPDAAEKQWLFPAGNGRAGHLSISQVRTIIRGTMDERVGVEFHPHLFRALAVMLAFEHSPNAIEHCRQLLGDKSLEVVLRYYARVRRKQAAEHQDKLVDEAERLAALAGSASWQGRRKGGRS